VNALALLVALTVGQITVPTETAPYLPIVASVAAQMPDGATFDGGWTLEGAHFLPDGKNRIHIWAKPGEYKLEFSGLWLHLKDVTFTDGAGQEITITSYLGHGIVNESATFKVTGAPPGPDPPDEESPIAADGLRVMIVRESNPQSPYPAEQQVLINSTVWKASVGQGNWMVLDPDTVFRKESIWKSAMEATVKFGTPRVIVSNRPHGGYVGPLPTNLKDLTDLIEHWAGVSGGK
jgi:hypothetical protein